MTQKKKNETENVGKHTQSVRTNIETIGYNLKMENGIQSQINHNKTKFDTLIYDINEFRIRYNGNGQKLECFKSVKFISFI